MSSASESHIEANSRFRQTETHRGEESEKERMSQQLIIASQLRKLTIETSFENPNSEDLRCTHLKGGGGFAPILVALILMRSPPSTMYNPT